MMDAVTHLRQYFGGDANVEERIRDACDRTRPFYVKFRDEMTDYLKSKTPEEDFTRKTSLSESEFMRRLVMLKIYR